MRAESKGLGILALKGISIVSVKDTGPTFVQEHTGRWLVGTLLQDQRPLTLSLETTDDVSHLVTINMIIMETI